MSPGDPPAGLAELPLELADSGAVDERMAAEQQLTLGRVGRS